MRKIILAPMFAAVLLALPAKYSQAQEFRLLTSWNENFDYHPYILYPFVEGIKKASEGRMTITPIHGPETVPPFEQLQPVGAGVFDFLFTHGAYHFGTTPVMLAVEAIEGHPRELRETGMFDVLDGYYKKFGLKLVVLPVSPRGSYHIMLREAVYADGVIRGRKIRGTLTQKGIIEMLGGVLVVLPPTEIYSALEKGVVDGASWPVVGALGYHWYEVADYLLRPAFGVNYEPIFMNLDRWNSLSSEDQEIIINVAKHVENSWYEKAPEVWKTEENALIEKGMKITEMGAEQKEKLHQAFVDGVWSLAAEKDAKLVRELRNTAKSKGLTR